MWCGWGCSCLFMFSEALVALSGAPAAPFAGRSPAPTGWCSCAVIPAKAGIYGSKGLDPRLRGDDGVILHGGDGVILHGGDGVILHGGDGVVLSRQCGRLRGCRRSALPGEPARSAGGVGVSLATQTAEVEAVKQQRQQE